MNNKSKRIVLVGLLAALGYVSLYFIRIPIIPQASFLRLDIKDTFIAIGGILLGPAYAFIGAIGVSFLQMLSVSEYGIIEFIMNTISVSSFSIPIAFCVNKNYVSSRLLIGLLIGSVSMVTVMLLWNCLITPLYMGVSREAVIDMLIPVFLPFNAIKATINSLMIFCLSFVTRRFWK